MILTHVLRRVPSDVRNPESNMTTNSVSNVGWLLDKLEDPFTMFPIESVARTLLKAVDEAEMRKMDCTWWGPSRKYWSVEQEHYHEEIGLLVGAIFVLGQAAITQTVSILNELRKHPEAESVIPKDKARKLVEHAATETKTNLSEIVIINAASNYFKHVYEWQEEWNTTQTKSYKTIDILLKCGVTEGDLTDNLLRVADILGIIRSNPRSLATSIQEWREGWARVLYHLFGLPDPNRAFEHEDLPSSHRSE